MQLRLTKLGAIFLAGLFAVNVFQPAQANYFDCSVVYDEFDQLMMANFLIDPERYVTSLDTTLKRSDFLVHQLNKFKLREERTNAGLAVFRTNQNISGKFIFFWQDNAWEEVTPFVVEESISFGRVRDGYAPVRGKSLYLTPGQAVDLDTSTVVELDDDSADFIYEIDQENYQIRAINSAQMYFPVESMCHKREELQGLETGSAVETTTQEVQSVPQTTTSE